MDGTTGIVYGPHKKFSEIEENFRKSNPNSNFSAKAYLSSSVIEYRNAYHDVTSGTALGNISDSGDLLCGTEQVKVLDSYNCSGLPTAKTPKCVKNV